MAIIAGIFISQVNGARAQIYAACKLKADMIISCDAGISCYSADAAPGAVNIDIGARCAVSDIGEVAGI